MEDRHTLPRGDWMMPYLYQIRGDGEEVEHWEIGDKPVVVGRGPRADVRIEDERLSREHFAVSRDGNTFVLYDLNSRNGTWVDGQRVLRAELRPSDTIRAGRTRFLFKEGLVPILQKLDGHTDVATQVMQ
jgi:pSer/pThr/pTyr-binding forkhead associated (FHA) protein